MSLGERGRYTQSPYMIDVEETELNAESVLKGLDQSIGEEWEREDGAYSRNFEIAGQEYVSRIIVEVQDNFVEAEHFLEPVEQKNESFISRLLGNEDLEGHFDYDEESNPCPEAYQEFPVPDEEVPRIKNEERKVLYDRLSTSKTSTTSTEGVAGFRARTNLNVPWGQSEGTGYRELNNMDSVVNAVINRDYQAIPWTEKLE